VAQQYKILSDRCTLGELGAFITPTDISPDNLLALVDGGHIEAVVTKSNKTEEK